MPSFGNVVSGLKAVTAALDATRESAERTRSSVRGARSEVESLSSTIDQSRSKADAFASQTQRIREAATDGRQELSLLDDLFAANAATTNDFSEKFGRFIEAVRIGALDVNQLKNEMGDASIVIDGEFVRIRELFSGADLGRYREEIQDLVGALSRGKTELGEVIEFIASRAGNLAKGLVNMLKLFQQGKATLEQVQAALNAARATFPPGGEVDALLNGIENGILDGSLGAG